MTGELPLRPCTMLMLAAAAARTVACRRVTTSRVDGDGVLAPGQDRALYNRSAPRYLAGAYRLLGARRLARPASTALHLRHGDTIIGLGCGTGTLLLVLADA